MKPLKSSTYCFQFSKLREMGSFQFLPQEVTSYILSWLPAKSVGQCRCVCKQWRDLLCQPQFIKTHLTHSKLLPHYSLVFLGNDDIALFSMCFSNGNAHQLFDENTVLPKRLRSDVAEAGMIIHGSCDGLILVEDYEDAMYRLVNPATQQSREVPYPPLTCKKSNNLAGLGYDSITDDYKIVSMSYKDNSVNVFSVKNGTWKSAGSFPFEPDLWSWCSTVLVDGRIHWIALSRSSQGDCKQVLVAFDFANEKFSEVQIPTMIEEHKYGLESYWPRVLGGCLCLCARGQPDGPLQTEVWMMKEYGVQNSWAVLKVNHPVKFTPLCFLSQGQLVLMVDESGLRLVTYNMADGTSKEIVYSPEHRRVACFETISESLVSPH